MQFRYRIPVIGPWLIRRSPSAQWMLAGEVLTGLIVTGFEQGARDAAQWRAEGLSEEEILARAMASVTPEFLAYAEGVAKRSFWSLYEDDED